MGFSREFFGCVSLWSGKRNARVRRICCCFLARIQWSRFSLLLSVLVFARFKFPRGKQNVVDFLIQRFPQEEGAIRAYFKLCDEVTPVSILFLSPLHYLIIIRAFPCSSLALRSFIFCKTFLPTWIASWIVPRLYSKIKPFFESSLYDIAHSFTHNEELISVLGYACGDMEAVRGGTEDRERQRRASAGREDSELESGSHGGGRMTRWTGLPLLSSSSFFSSLLVVLGFSPIDSQNSPFCGVFWVVPDIRERYVIHVCFASELSYCSLSVAGLSHILRCNDDPFIAVVSVLFLSLSSRLFRASLHMQHLGSQEPCILQAVVIRLLLQCATSFHGMVDFVSFDAQLRESSWMLRIARQLGFV